MKGVSLGILFGSIGLLFLLFSGCFVNLSGNNQEPVRFICPDGTEVSDTSQCPKDDFKPELLETADEKPEDSDEMIDEQKTQLEQKNIKIISVTGHSENYASSDGDIHALILNCLLASGSGNINYNDIFLGFKEGNNYITSINYSHVITLSSNITDEAKTSFVIRRLKDKDSSPNEVLEDGEIIEIVYWIQDSSGTDIPIDAGAEFQITVQPKGGKSTSVIKTAPIIINKEYITDWDAIGSPGNVIGTTKSVKIKGVTGYSLNYAASTANIHALILTCQLASGSGDVKYDDIILNYQERNNNVGGINYSSVQSPDANITDASFGASSGYACFNIRNLKDKDPFPNTVLESGEIIEIIYWVQLNNGTDIPIDPNDEFAITVQPGVGKTTTVYKTAPRVIVSKYITDWG